MQRPWGDMPGEATGTLGLDRCSQTSLAMVPRPVEQCPPRAAFKTDSFLADSPRCQDTAAWPLVVAKSEAAPLGRSAALKGQQGDRHRLGAAVLLSGLGAGHST